MVMVVFSVYALVASRPVMDGASFWLVGMRVKLRVAVKSPPVPLIPVPPLPRSLTVMVKVTF